MRLTKHLFSLFALILVSCECPYQDELDRAQQRKTTGDVLEFKQIKFMSGGKADITMAKQHDTEWYTETYNYAYYGNTLRFSRSGSNISLTIDGYLFPELYLRDSFGRYTMAKRRADGC